MGHHVQRRVPVYFHPRRRLSAGRRRLVPATVYSVGLVLVTYVLVVYGLKTPLHAGPLGF
jgi:hypothetical protein